jgi:hypothetical protein
MPSPGLVSEKIKSDHYHNYMYNKVHEEFTNYRNRFTKDYYDSLIESKDKIFLVSEMRKYSEKKFYDADVIICYRNKTRRNYNKLMLEHLRLKRYDIGNEFVCLTNRLMKHGYYNGKVVKIIDKDNKYFYLDDESQIPRKRFAKNFDLTFALTCYKVQGKTKDSYYWCPEDDWFVNSNVAYTTISRIKQRLEPQVTFDLHVKKYFNMIKNKRLDESYKRFDNMIKNKSTIIDDDFELKVI